ncbi:hypothetical protein FI667_g12671, partial [Globisporangium splendens]
MSVDYYGHIPEPSAQHYGDSRNDSPAGRVADCTFVLWWGRARQSQTRELWMGARCPERTPPFTKHAGTRRGPDATNNWCEDNALKPGLAYSGHRLHYDIKLEDVGDSQMTMTAHIGFATICQSKLKPIAESQPDHHLLYVNRLGPHKTRAQQNGRSSRQHGCGSQGYKDTSQESTRNYLSLANITNHHQPGANHVLLAALLVALPVFFFTLQYSVVLVVVVARRASVPRLTRESSEAVADYAQTLNLVIIVYSTPFMHPRMVTVTVSIQNEELLSNSQSLGYRNPRHGASYAPLERRLRMRTPMTGSPSQEESIEHLHLQVTPVPNLPPHPQE